MVKRGRKPNLKSQVKSEPLSEVPSRPSNLVGVAAEYWDRLAPQLVKANILTPLLVDSFALCCQHYSEYQRWQVYLDENPDKYTYVTESGYEQVAPAVTLRDRALASWYRLAAKFGLTADALAKMRKHGGIGSTKRLPAALAFAAQKRDDDEEDLG